MPDNIKLKNEELKLLKKDSPATGGSTTRLPSTGSGRELVERSSSKSNLQSLPREMTLRLSHRG